MSEAVMVGGINALAAINNMEKLCINMLSVSKDFPDQHKYWLDLLITINSAEFQVNSHPFHPNNTFLGGIKVVLDASLPPGSWELRNPDGSKA